MRTPAGRRRRIAISLSLSSSEILMPSTLDGMRFDDAQRGVHRGVRRRRCPSSRPAPDRTCRPASAAPPAACAWLQHAVVDAFVVGRALGHARQRAAGHDDQLAAELFDRRHLLFVGADHVVDRLGVFRRQVVGAAAAGQEGAGHVLARRRCSGGSVPATWASRAPCRAAPCPSPRPRPGPCATAAGGRRWWRPSRSRIAATGRWRRSGVGHHVRGRIGDAVELRVPGAARRDERPGRAGV